MHLDLAIIPFVPFSPQEATHPMRIPKQRIRFAKNYEGHPSAAGFLVLDLKGLDLEGVNTIVIPVEDSQAALAAGDREDDAREKLKNLLGG